MKRLWSLLLVLLLIPCLAVVVSAAEKSGACGDNLTWVFEDTTGTLTISGTGDMWNYYYIDEDDWERIYTPWDRSKVKSVIIEEGVTSVGSAALYKAGNLKEVVLPASIGSIEELAFGDCSDLKVRLPDNDTVQINQYAFAGSSITVVEIPAKMTQLPIGIFNNRYLTDYIVAEDNSVFSVSDGILFNKDQTELIACPGKHEFADGQYTVPDSVTVIGTEAFSDCVSLKSVILSDSVTTIGVSAFSSCTNLRSVTIPDSVRTIGHSAFGASWDVETVYISDLTKWLEIQFGSVYANPLCYGAVLNLNGTEITDLVIPEGATAIGNYAFSGMRCSGSLTIPSSVTSIAASAFDFYTEPEAVYISDLAAWMRIQFESKTANPIANGSDLYVNGVLLTELVVPDGVTVIGDYAFSNCDTLTSLTIPDSVTSIGNVAFWDCNGLTSVTISDSVTTIGRSAFEACSNLTQVRLPKSLKVLSNKIFKNCESLTSVDIPDSVTSIGESAFERCFDLAEVRIPKKLTVVKGSAFKDCQALTSITLPDTVTSIGSFAFDQCSSLTSIHIPEGITTINSYTFRLCRGLTSVTIPDSVTSIGAYAFAYCSGLKELKVSTALKELGNYAFTECKRIKELNLPGAIGEIPFGLAKNCISLQRVTMGEGITYIDRDAFNGCTTLTAISIPSTIREIYRDAFKNCTGLKDFYLQSIKTWIELQFVYENFAEEGEGLSHYYSFDYFTDSNSEPKNLYVKGEKLTDLVIPEGTEYLVDYMFHSTTIQSVTIPSSMSSISEHLFSQCKNLCSVAISAETDYIDDNAFAGCENLSKVYYGGSKTRRGKIDIEDGNGRLENASWVYNCNLELSAPVIKITGVASSGKPKVTWTAVEGAERYRVYRATSKSGSYTYLGYTTALSYTDKTAKAGTNYYYKVTAFDSDNQSASLYSNVVNRCCDLKRPVVTLKVDTASGKPKITFENISGAEKYYIVRSASKTGTYSKVATITGTTYIDKTAKAGTNYYYKVKALHAKDAADSAYSAVTNRVCDLAKPVVTIKCNTSGNPWLKWEAISGAQKYEVYRATSSTGTYKLVKTTKTATSFADKDVTAGKTYYYKVRAIHENTAANSAYSAVKYIKAQ